MLTRVTFYGQGHLVIGVIALDEEFFANISPVGWDYVVVMHVSIIKIPRQSKLDEG